jgi:hypothetical protein
VQLQLICVCCGTLHLLVLHPPRLLQHTLQMQ